MLDMKLENAVDSMAHCLVDRPDQKVASGMTKGSKPRSWLPRVWLGGCLVLATLAGFLAMASPQQAAEESHTRIEEALRPIASFRVGDAVLADAEHGDGDTALGSQVDPATWRHLALLCRKTDGSIADVELLRPLTWLKEQGAVSGGSVEISVPECGIEGQARVLSIDDCPPLQPTPPGYRTVTGTFHHQATTVMDVLVEGTDQPIGTTPNHPFWSEDRQDYVRADSLQIGERLLGESGPVRVKSLAPRGSPEPVYNIEVHCDHNYRVADSSVLVHNGNQACPARLREYRNRWFGSRNRTIASTSDGQIFVSGRNPKRFPVSRSNSIVRTGARENRNLLNYLNRLRKRAKQEPVPGNPRATPADIASHAELQAVYSLKQQGRIKAGDVIKITISKQTGPCSSCIRHLRLMAQDLGATIKVVSGPGSNGVFTAYP